MSKFHTWISLLPHFGPKVEPYPQRLADFVKKPGRQEEAPTGAKVEKDTFIRVDEEDIRKYRSLIG